MVNEYIRYRIPPELREKFLADYAAACDQLTLSRPHSHPSGRGGAF